MTYEGIEFELSHTRTKSLRMRITREGTVKVSVPSFMSFEAAKLLVKDNVGWAKEQLARLEDSSSARVPLSEAATVQLWGDGIPFSLIRESDRKRIAAKQTKDGIVVHAPLDATDDVLRSALDRILVKELETRTAELAPDLEARIGKHAAQWRFRRMSTRWGSCNTKTAIITINTALAELDPVYLEYVMCHELCHLWESNHGSAFYARLEAACPEWRRLRAELKSVTP